MDSAGPRARAASSLTDHEESTMKPGSRCNTERTLFFGPLFVSFFLASSLPSCSETKECPTPTLTSDTTAWPDLSVPDSRGEAKPDLSAQCQKDKVQCKSDETNAFGVCLAASSMIKIPAGEFTMGKNEEGRPHNPEHKVTLKEFFIDQTEVTVEQYQACVTCGICPAPQRDGSHTGREPYYGNDKYKNFPVIYVSWTDAKTYCEGIGKQLPTEAQWEKAARGEDGRDYPWGSTEPTKTLANFNGNLNDTAPVTDFDAGKSPSGVLNLAGNVWEWVADSYSATYYGKSPAADPTGPETGPVKVIRGGGFTSSSEQLRTFLRASEAETSGYSHLGFRCAKEK
jgi:formylglycine-generating enzyme required for sulfatase activity